MSIVKSTAKRNFSDKLGRAVQVLAAADAPIQARLAGAAEYLVRIRPEELPYPVRGEFRQLLYILTRREPVSAEGFIWATTSRLTGEESTELAERIFRLYNTLCAPTVPALPRMPSRD